MAQVSFLRGSCNCFAAIFYTISPRNGIIRYCLDHGFISRRLGLCVLYDIAVFQFYTISPQCRVIRHCRGLVLYDIAAFLSYSVL